MNDLMWDILKKASRNASGIDVSGYHEEIAAGALEYRGFGSLDKSTTRFSILPAGTYVISHEVPR